MNPDGGGICMRRLFYDSPDALLAAAVPFLRDGLAVGDVPVLVCRDWGNALLAEALGTDAGVVVLDPGGVYTRTVDAVATYQHMVRACRRTGRTACGWWGRSTSACRTCGPSGRGSRPS